MPHLTGPQSGYGCHGTCPVEANECPTHSATTPVVSRQDSHAENVWWETRNVCVFACAHAYREAAIKRTNGLFEVSEEVGHVIVQPCVLHAWGRASMVPSAK